MLNRGSCVGMTGRTARAGISLAAAAMLGGGLVAVLPASPASATGTGTDLVTVSSSLNPSVYGEKVSFNVSVAATGLSIGIPTGLLTFSYTNSFNGGTVFNPVCSESGSNVVSLNLSGLATCTPTAALLGGNDAITASYGGDLAFLGNLGILSTPGGQTINPMTTTIAVVDNGPSPSAYGQPVSLTTTVTAHPTANPQATVIPIFNTVNFSGNGSPLPDCSSVNFSSQTATTATASCSTKDLPAGSPVTVGSFYNGDGNYQTALATGINHTVNKATTAASTPLSSSNPVPVNSPVTYTTTVNPATLGFNPPTGTVTFFDGAAHASCSGGNPAALAVNLQATCATTYASNGNHPITAVYSGDSNYVASPASGVLNQMVGNGSTTTVANNGPSPSTYGQSVSFAATVAGTGASAPTGNVTFSSGATVLCTKAVSTSSGKTTATCSTTLLPVGSDPVTAAYSGDGAYQPSAGGTNQTVNKSPTTVSTPGSSSNPVAPNTSVIYTTTLTPATAGASAPTGTVTFSDNGTAIPACSGANAPQVASDLASCTIAGGYGAVGQHSITALYNGDGNYGASPASAALSQVVCCSTGVTVTSSGPSTYGQTVTFTATLTAAQGFAAPSGTVTFTNGATVLCDKKAVSTSGGTTTATCLTSALPVGSDPITASYSGDATYQAAQGAMNQTVNKAPTTASTPGSTSNPVTTNTPVTYTTTVTPTTAGPTPPSGTVTFWDNGAAVGACSGANAPHLAGSQATCTISGGYGAVGQHSITALYNGDGNYGASPASAALSQVVCCSTAITLASGGPSNYGQTVTFTATLTAAQGFAAPSGTVTFTNGATVLCDKKAVSTSGGTTTATCSTSALPVGSDPITASYSGDATYQAAQGAMNQTVNKAPTTASTPVSSSNPVPLNQPVTYTTTIIPASTGPSAPTGTVTFSDNGVAIPACSGASAPHVASNQASCTLPAGYAANGQHSITAVYNGDSNYAPSISQAISEDVALPGYWMVAANGSLSGFGPTPNLFGSESGAHLNAPIVGMVRDPATGGYWLVAADGGVFAFNAPFFGSMAGKHLNKAIVAIVAAPGGNGYWLVAADGGVFTFGPGARFYGSLGSSHLNQPVVGMAVAPGGNGYWLVAADGGVFTFGPGAIFYGSLVGTHLNGPVVGIAAAPGGGYWVVAADGGVFTFGPGAIFYGSMGGKPLNRPIIGIVVALDGHGYWLFAGDGGVFTFGPSAAFYGSMVASPLSGQVVGLAGMG